MRPSKKLLAGLAARIKCARDLRAAKGTVGQKTAVFARKWHALRDALIDDRCADFRQTIDIRFPRAEIAALDRVVEQSINAVAVVLIILGGVDSALGGNRVRAARAVLVTKTFDVDIPARQASPPPTPPANPLPTMISSNFRLFAGLMILALFL